MQRRVLSAYRQLLRAQKHVFRGDLPMQQAARVATREQFVNHRDVSDAGQVEQHLLEAEEARRFLLEGLVQGKLNERGNYELRVEPQHTTKEGEEPDPIKDPTAST